MDASDFSPSVVWLGLSRGKKQRRRNYKCCLWIFWLGNMKKGQSCKKDSQWKCPEGIAPRIKDTERGAVLWYLIL